MSRVNQTGYLRKTLTKHILDIPDTERAKALLMLSISE